MKRCSDRATPRPTRTPASGTAASRSVQQQQRPCCPGNVLESIKAEGWPQGSGRLGWGYHGSIANHLSALWAFGSHVPRHHFSRDFIASHACASCFLQLCNVDSDCGDMRLHECQRVVFMNGVQGSGICRRRRWVRALTRACVGGRGRVRKCERVRAETRTCERACTCVCLHVGLSISM